MITRVLLIRNGKLKLKNDFGLVDYEAALRLPVLVSVDDAYMEPSHSKVFQCSRVPHVHQSILSVGKC